MTARFEAFKEALHALCIEHGVRLHRGDAYDDNGVYVEVAKDYAPAGLDCWLTDDTDLCPRDEELARERAERKARDAERQREFDEWYAQRTQRGDYLAMQRIVEADAKETRKNQMRISTDPNDPAFIDARPRKVWVNEQLIEGWTVADEFRRVVITPEKVHHGAVLIERLPDVVKDEPQFVRVESGTGQGAGVASGPAAEVPIEQLPRVQQETRPAKRRR